MEKENAKSVVEMTEKHSSYSAVNGTETGNDVSGAEVIEIETWIVNVSVVETDDVDVCE